MAVPPPASIMEARLIGGPPWGRVGTVPSWLSEAVAAGGPCGRVGTLLTPSVPVVASAGSCERAATAGINVSTSRGAAAAAGGWLPAAGVRGAAAIAATAAGVAGLPAQPWLPLGRGLLKLLGPVVDDTGVVAGSGLSTGGPTSRVRRFLR